jgi:hypothetical protein
MAVTMEYVRIVHKVDVTSWLMSCAVHSVDVTCWLMSFAVHIVDVIWWLMSCAVTDLQHQQQKTMWHMWKVWCKRTEGDWIRLLLIQTFVLVQASNIVHCMLEYCRVLATWVPKQLIAEENVFSLQELDRWYIAGTDVTVALTIMWRDGGFACYYLFYWT